MPVPQIHFLISCRFIDFSGPGLQSLKNLRIRPEDGAVLMAFRQADLIRNIRKFNEIPCLYRPVLLFPVSIKEDQPVLLR